MFRSGIHERGAIKISGHKAKEVFGWYSASGPGDLKQVAQQMGQCCQMVTISGELEDLTKWIENGSPVKVNEINRECLMSESGGTGRRAGFRIQWDFP